MANSILHLLKEGKRTKSSSFIFELIFLAYEDELPGVDGVRLL
jgi:hypothetical protein